MSRTQPLASFAWALAAALALPCSAAPDAAVMSKAFPARGASALALADPQVAEARQLVAKALGEDAVDLVFVPITPCTVWDTRFASEPQSAGLIANGQTKRFFSHDGAGGNYITWGGNPSCPGTLEAAIGGRPFAALMTIYINDATANGWLTLYRDGDPDPSNATISVYYSGGPTRTQTVISKSSRGYGSGTFDVAATSRFGSVNAAAAVTGYFLKPQNISLPHSTATTGNILKNGDPFLHNAGTDNTFLGLMAGTFGVTGTGNVGLGTLALSSIGSGNSNIGIGYNALGLGASGDNNIAIGSFALENNTGSNNVGVGLQALSGNTTGTGNTGIGYSALMTNATGIFNVAVGRNALLLTTSSQNTGVGNNAGVFVTTGTSNTLVGHNAGVALTTGSSNIFVGADTGTVVTTGNNNVYLAASGANENATIRIGSNIQSRAFISGVSGVTSTAGTTVFVNASGQLGTSTSMRAVKDTITDIDEASARLMKLRPVKFYYREDEDPAGRQLQYGLIAEEVAQVAPELVHRKADGSPQTVYYQFLPPMLLNEYQKQQRTIEALQAEVAELRAQAARTARLLERLEAR
jgi:hypothetical protein